MRQLVHYYKNYKGFKKWTDEHHIKDSNRLLIEINYPDSDQQRLQKILNKMHNDFPNSIIVGMQSFTSMIDHQISDTNKDPIISIMEFQSSRLTCEVLDIGINYVKGQAPVLDLTKIVKHLQIDTKALEILSSYNEAYTSSYINQIGQHLGHLKIFGGGATHNQHKKCEFVFHNNIIYPNAVILIFMHGESLNVELFQAFDWKPISKKKKITEVDGSSVITIDNIAALDIYKKYFPNIEENQSVSIQVPLYITKNNISSTAHILDIDFKNQSLKVAQPLEVGDIVQLSIGNYNAMMNRVEEIQEFLTKTPAQALWIGSCISYEYGFRIPIFHYISTIKSNNHIFGYSTSLEFFNTENQPNTCHNHTFIMAAITESISEYIELNRYTHENIGPFEIANKNLYSIMHKTASELNQLAENLESMVEQRTEELNNLNKDLQKKIKDAIRKEKRQNAVIAQQSRLASMGEILENIAHQWRQPLNHVSWIMNDTLIKAQLGNRDEINIEELAKKVNNSIQFLAETIEDFRRFVDKSSDLPQTFNIKKAIEATILLINETLIRSEIEIKLDCPDDIKYKGFENDIKHVIMNLINNARDAMEEREIENGLIRIRVYHEKDELVIAVQDNAGGIPKPILKNIFEPYFTTKHKSKGTGLGLYMSKNLIDKVNGDIQVISILNKKTTFIIRLPEKGATPNTPLKFIKEEENK